MAADPVMRWVVDARNHIEKVGDLELKSTARATVVADWLESPVTEFEVPPLMPPHLIAQGIADGELPERIRKEGILRVERRWVAPDLPDWELLDASSHAWAFLDSVLIDAEAEFLGDEPDQDRFRIARLDCMTAGPEARTATLHLASGDFRELETKEHRTTEPQLVDARPNQCRARRTNATGGSRATSTIASVPSRSPEDHKLNAYATERT
jgi:hypothetical protein